MTVAWDEHVNQRILRVTDWNDPDGFLEDETLSGKTKRRADHFMAKRTFGVHMRFTKAEYGYFRAWYELVCLRGVNSWNFPTIDGSGTSKYRFKKGGSPRYINPSGVLIDCTMTWEQV